MANKKLQEIISFKEKYKNKWVAKSKDSGEILVASKTLTSVAKKLQHSNEDYTLEWVYPPNISFASHVTNVNKTTSYSYCL